MVNPLAKLCCAIIRRISTTFYPPNRGSFPQCNYEDTHEYLWGWVMKVGVKYHARNASRCERHRIFSQANTHYITIFGSSFDSLYLPAAKSSEVKRLFFSWAVPQPIPKNNKLTITSYYCRLSTIIFKLELRFNSWFAWLKAGQTVGAGDWM